VSESRCVRERGSGSRNRVMFRINNLSDSRITSARMGRSCLRAQLADKCRRLEIRVIDRAFWQRSTGVDESAQWAGGSEFIFPSVVRAIRA
jgi:hypothetical protein